MSAVKKEKRRRQNCPVTKYAQDVLAGKIPANLKTKQAAQRHINDLDSCHARGLVFDYDASMHAIDSIQHLRQSKGEWAGKPLVLGAWQKFIVGSIFGWKNGDGTRRFQTAYVEIPRKNGKSTLAAAIALYMLAFDREPGAEVYTAATKKDQARIVFDEAKRMVRKLPSHWRLRRDLELNKNSIVLGPTESVMMPLSADAHSMDGLNPHCCVIDELHAHKTRAVFDVLNTATGARRQPLIFQITTAGWDRLSVCWEQHEYSRKVLEGTVDDDSFFAFIAGLDEGDDWRDEKNWAKANPNYGVSVKVEGMRKAAKRAAETPGELNAFLRLRLNVWTEQADRWLDMAAWADCLEEYTAESLLGRHCFGGLDMAATEDLGAFVLVFPPVAPGEKWKVLCWFFIPQDTVRKREEKNNTPWSVWIRQGLIEATPGPVIDFDTVRTRIEDVCTKYQVKEIAFDRYFATQLVTQLMSGGLEMVQFGQGFVSMAAPTRMLSHMIAAKEFAHDGNPVLRWCASNVAVRQDPAGNLKPDKEKSSEKIDGIVATIMGLGRAIMTEQERKGHTEEHGVVSL